MSNQGMRGRDEFQFLHDGSEPIRIQELKLIPTPKQIENRSAYLTTKLTSAVRPFARHARPHAAHLARASSAAPHLRSRIPRLVR